MRPIAILITALGLLALGGCASLAPPDSYYNAQAAAAASWAAAEQARNARKPDLVMSCEAGCWATYTHPDLGQRPAAPAVSEGTTGGAVAVAAIREGGAWLREATPYATVYGVASRALDAAGDRTLTVNGDSNQLQQDYNQATVQRWGDGSGNDRHDTTDNSDHSDRSDHSDHSDRRQNYDNATAPPLVVEPEVVQVPVEVVYPEVVMGPPQ